MFNIVYNQMNNEKGKPAVIKIYVYFSVKWTDLNNYNHKKKKTKRK